METQIRHKYSLMAAGFLLVSLVSLLGCLSPEQREERDAMGAVIRQVPLRQVVEGEFFVDVHRVKEGHIVIVADDADMSFPRDESAPGLLIYFVSDLESKQLYAVNEAAMALTPSFPARPELLDELEVIDEDEYLVFSDRIDAIQQREVAQETPIHGRMKLVIDDIQQFPSSHELGNGDPSNGEIIVEFSILSRRQAFTLNFSGSMTPTGLSGEGYSVTVSGEDLVIDTMSNGSMELPFGVLHGENHEDVCEETRGYLWGIYSVFVHLFPLTEGWIDVNMFVPMVDYADRVVTEGELEGKLKVEAHRESLKMSWTTDVSYDKPVLTHKKELVGEMVSYEYSFIDYSEWAEGDLIFPRKVTGDGFRGRYHSELMTVSPTPLSD